MAAIVHAVLRDLSKSDYDMVKLDITALPEATFHPAHEVFVPEPQRITA